MAKSNVKAAFHSDIETLWNIITYLGHYAWRSDISKIEIVEDKKQFIEYTSDGYPTTFTITAFEPYSRYEFDMENTKMHGHWTGLIEETDEGTVVDFTEDVTAKSLLLRPFVKAYLKKQQEQYICDLKKGLDG